MKRRPRKPREMDDEALLDEFRRGPCEYCGNRGRTEAHHIVARGMGGGRRLDIRINLVALCSIASGRAGCHRLHHDGKKPNTADLVAIAAKREGVTVAYIERTMLELRRRHPNDPEGGEL